MNTKTLPTLYNRATNGKITVRHTDIQEQPDGQVHIIVQHGYLGGKLQTDTKVVSKGKNIGKANETTIWDQALADAISACNRKRDEGYVEDQADIKDRSAGYFLPMLAKDFTKDSKKIKYPCYVQPKLDGMRALARKTNGVVEMWSRQGKPITTPTKILEELTTWLDEGESVDGEIYVHGWDFQRLISAVKRTREDTEALEYWVYDRPDQFFEFCQRRLIIKNKSGGDNIKLVPTWDAESLEQIYDYQSELLSHGFEGIMIRNYDGPYAYDDRSYDLQKLKNFETAEFEIIGGRSGTGRASDCVIYTCKTKNNLTFEVYPQGTIENRKALFQTLNQDIGKFLTVKFFEYTQDGIPRFPIGIIIRDYEA
jgi:DNA ligase-1